MKDREKGNDITYSRLLECLVENYIYTVITNWKIKGCCQKNKRGIEKNQEEAKGQFLIDKMILSCQKRLTRLEVT